MDTDQFTARIDSRVMRIIKQQAKQKGRSINEELNDILRLGIITLANRRKAAKITNQTALHCSQT